MVPFRPFHPLILAIAQELQRRADENQANPLETLKALLEERPHLDVAGHATMAQQINDLMVLSQPADDRLRLALMLFLPHRRGSLFTANEMLLRDALFFPTAPCTGMARALAVNLDEKWPEVVQTIKMMPLPPMALAGANGLPIEAKHPAAAGPLPVNIQDFMKPDRP